jgi:hypothetical protein
MTHNTIVTAFTVSLIIGMALGVLLAILWAKKIFRKLLGSMERHAAQNGRVSLNITAVQTLFYMLPGLLALIACCIPAIYFNYLLKQENYCQQLIKVNQRMTKDAPSLLKHCGALDLDALFKSARP